jgi:hypothetical protein
LDLRRGKNLKVITEKNLEKVEVEALDLKPLTGPLVKMQNLVSVDETESQEEVEGKVTWETINSCNQWERAKEIEMLARVKEEDHSFAGKGDWAYMGQDHLLQVWVLEADVDSEANHQRVVDVEAEFALDLVAVVDRVVVEVEFGFPKNPGL